jgi:hypothetical protein
VLGSQGLHRVSAQHTLVWDIAVFARRNA